MDDQRGDSWMNEQRHIDFYFDFSSPYGFIASQTLEAVLPAGAPQVKWHPFLIAAVYERFGSAPVKQPLKYNYEMMDCLRTASHVGVDGMQIPPGFPHSPVMPSRIFYWLDSRDEDTARAYAKAVYRVYFTCGKAALKDIAVEFAREHGMTGTEIDDACNGADNKTVFKERSDAALAAGVFGSPFFIFGDKPFWGTDRMQQLAAAVSIHLSERGILNDA